MLIDEKGHLILIFVEIAERGEIFVQCLLYDASPWLADVADFGIFAELFDSLGYTVDYSPGILDIFCFAKTSISAFDMLAVLPPMLNRRSIFGPVPYVLKMNVISYAGAMCHLPFSSRRKEKFLLWSSVLLVMTLKTIRAKSCSISDSKMDISLHVATISS